MWFQSTLFHLRGLRSVCLTFLHRNLSAFCSARERLWVGSSDVVENVEAVVLSGGALRAATLQAGSPIHVCLQNAPCVLG